jgi:hypothetical protein
MIAGAADASGYLVDHINDAFIAVNRVLASGGTAYWFTDPVGSYDEGAFYLEADRSVIEGLATEKGLRFEGVASRPAGNAMELEPVKIGLWDRYGGSMPSGWTRMILEDFEFDFEVLYAPDLDNADLSEYDVLLFEDGAIPAAGGGDGGGRGGRGGIAPTDIPAEFSTTCVRAARRSRSALRLVSHNTRACR